MPADILKKDLPLNEAGWFTTTHWSVVLTAGGDVTASADAAMERLCRTYWYPLYAYTRWRGYSAEDGEDLTQEFFARLLQKNFLAQVGPEKGKFRSFLLASLNHFLANDYDRATAQKRGRGQATISLDAAAAEGMFALEPVCERTPETLFDERWAAALLDQAFVRLRSEYTQAGKLALFNELSPFLTADSASGDYAPVAQRLNMGTGAVTVAVHRLRQKYRECVRAQVAETVASPADLEDEMRHLFAVLAG
jgi:DNA-directed RNA polymerase specialized sigma24 family protein